MSMWTSGQHPDAHHTAGANRSNGVDISGCQQSSWPITSDKWAFSQDVTVQKTLARP